MDCQLQNQECQCPCLLESSGTMVVDSTAPPVGAIISAQFTVEAVASEGHLVYLYIQAKEDLSISLIPSY